VFHRRLMMVVWSSALAGTLLFCVAQRPAPADGHTTPARPAAGNFCPPLAAPIGPTITVDTESRIRSLAYSAAPSTTILIAPGTYALQDYVHIVNAGIALRGATGNRDDVILDFGGMTTGHFGVLVSADDVTVADLTIRNSTDHGVSIEGVDRPVLYNLHILDTNDQLVKVNPLGDGSDDGLLACSRLGYTTTDPDGYTNGISAHGAHGWTVRDNTWVRVRTPTGTPVPTILFWSGSSDTIVERNVLIDCSQGIAFGNASQTGINHTGGVVRNNMIYSGQQHDVMIEMVRATGWLVAHNTVIGRNPAPGLTWSIEARFAESQGTFANNLTNMDIWADRDGAGAVTTDNTTTAQPSWFVNGAPASAEEADLHLVPTAVDAIDATTQMPEVLSDIDGDARGTGAGADAGADEVPTPLVLDEQIYLPIILR